jgi:two-component system, chemotaxis family, sensor kinase CheA
MAGQDNVSAQAPDELLSRLSEQVKRVEPDDLSLLAQMHGWCELLAKEWRGNGDDGSALAERASVLMQQLEKIILGEVEDSKATLAQVGSEIVELNGLVALGGSLHGVKRNEAPASVSPTKPEPVAAAPTAAATPAVSNSQATPAPGVPKAPAQKDAAPAYESTPLFLNEKELEFVKGFVEEAGEHIEAIEAAVLEVERNTSDLSKINDLFRPFHTIKGAAGFLNLSDITHLTHEVETLLDQARKGQRPVTPGVIDLVFDVVDILKAQAGSIGQYLQGPQSGPVPQPAISDMIGKLRDVVAYRLEPQARMRVEADSQRTGEKLVEQTNLPREVVDFALDLQQANPDRKTGQILVDMGAATARQVTKVLRAQGMAGSTAPAAAAFAEQTVRIDTTKLDLLVDMVGELVIAQTLVSSSPVISGDVNLVKNVNQVAKILRNLQEITLAMRMIPIGSTFQKMARLVRDTSRKAGKHVELTISGEDTELDKNVIQQIGDPLVHMVRNAIDHGVETPEARRAAGKPETGQVHLGASHQAGNILIEIRDDGKGLDPQKLIAKAIEKGLIEPGKELTDQEAYALIFAPGFSTAETVTDISGRGVGMDVVKRNIDRLRGKIDIESVKGSGTTFRIRLPLTLAIIDGMTVRAGDQRYIIPTISLQQALRPQPQQISTVQHRGQMIQVRGQLIPLIQLGQTFGLSGRIDPCEAMVVIANSDDGAVGVVVDELIGQQQVVIKSLGPRFEGLQGVSGAAILGDGRVGLILEIAGLAAMTSKPTASRN